MKAKKSLGQNFLKSLAIVRRIASVSNVSDKDIVLEIGPGKGILTKALLETGAKVVAVEKDDNLFLLLKEKFAEEIENNKFFLIHGDILDFSVSEIFEKTKPKAIGLHIGQVDFKLVANIPYYITGEIIRKFLEEKNQPKSMALLLQKEVAKRIAASDKKESILSLSVKVYGDPKYIETIKKNMFSPAPKVDSALIYIENISKKFFTENHISQDKFFEIIKQGFAHKRKVLINNLEKIIPKTKLLKCFEKNNLPLMSRAEDLNLEEWKNLIVSTQE